MTGWSLIPVPHGPLYRTRIYYAGVLLGEVLLTQRRYVDLRRRLGDEPDLHDLHPQPGDPAPPLPAGVDGFAPTTRHSSTTG